MGFIAPFLSPPQRGGGTAAAVGEERGFQKTMWVSAAKRVYLSRMIHTKKVILCGSPHPPSFGWSPFPAGEGKRTINPNLNSHHIKNTRYSRVVPYLVSRIGRACSARILYLDQMIPNSALSFSTRRTDSSMRSSEMTPSRTASSTAGTCFQ